MNSSEFQHLAIERAEDAKALLQAGRYAAAYYLAGYTIECGLKAVIAKQTNQGDFPPKNSARYYVHDIAQLRDLAALRKKCDDETVADKLFNEYWQTVKDWNEESRYRNREQIEASAMVIAVSDDDHGVLQWLKRYW